MSGLTLKKDQYCLEGRVDSLYYVSSIGNIKLAQTFIPSVSGQLLKVHLALRLFANVAPSSVWVHIKLGTPGGTNIASQLLSGITYTSYNNYIVTFSSPPTLVAGNTYSIVLACGGEAVLWLATKYTGSADYYTNGTAWRWDSYWTDLGYDYAFVTEMDVAVATPGLDVHIFGTIKDSATDNVSSNTDYLAQTFTPTVSAPLSKVQIVLARLDAQTGGNVTAEIQTTSGGLPTGTAVASEIISDVNIPVYDPNNTVPRLIITFSSPPTLTSGVLYALVLKFPDADVAVRYTNWTSKDVNQYSSGQRMRSTNSGGSWTTEARDMCFGSFMLEPTETTQTITSDARIKATTSQTIQSDAFAGQETSQNINSDARMGAEVAQLLTSDAFCGEETERYINADSCIFITSSQTVFSNSVIQATTTRLLTSNNSIRGTSLQFIIANSFVVQVTSQQISSDAHILINEPDLRLFTSAVPSVEIGTLANPLIFSGVIAGEDFIHPDNPFYLWNDIGGIKGSTDASAIIIKVLAFEVRDETVGYSDGNPSQTFVVAFIPVSDADATNHPITVKVNNAIWTRVANLLSSGLTDEVYTFDAVSGTITFGNGVQGKIPNVGAIIQASYTPIDIQHGLEVEEANWFGIMSSGVINNPVGIPLERQCSLDVNTVQVVHQHLTSVVAVYLDTDPKGLGTNYYTGGTYNATLGLITLGTPLLDPKTYVFVVYSYEIFDDSEPSYTQIGVNTSHQFTQSIPSNNAKLLYFRLSPPATANPSGPMNIYFRIRIDYQA
jgi:hypothetical protein